MYKYCRFCCWISAYCVLLLLPQPSSGSTEPPVVTLSHGGQLRGKSVTYNDTLSLDLFLGVRYAEAPVADLRFARPTDVKPWQGEILALSAGCVCTQRNFKQGGYYGSEDCLFLDITVPGGIQTAQTLKPVMVWLHGGSYFMWTGSNYPAAPLAVHGDVIVVTLNYRLGIFGFLSDGEGTGNFGLWDQRKALQWIQENISVFGGDPNNVTIFGEGSGASSVAAQVMSQQTSGLFNRAIQMSTGLYPNFAWYMTEKKSHEIKQRIRGTNGCCKESLYACLSGMTETEIGNLAIQLESLIPGPLWVPMSDNSFFAADINDEKYNFSNSVNLMVGLVGEGGGETLYFALNQGQSNGITEAAAANQVNYACTRNEDPNACYQNLNQIYEISEAKDDRERAIKLTKIWGEIEMNSDAVKELRSHSLTSNKTYAYYFTENYKPPAVNRRYNLPDWAKYSAKSEDQLPFTFGYIYSKEKPSVLQEYIAINVPDASAVQAYIDGPSESDKPLTDLMMTMLTNFAKSGNPNEPVGLPAGTPEWPQFSSSDETFMVLNSNNLSLVSTPDKDRLDSVLAGFREDRVEWLSKETPSVSSSPSDCETPTTNSGVINGSSRFYINALFIVVMMIAVWI